MHSTHNPERSVVLAPNSASYTVPYPPLSVPIWKCVCYIESLPYFCSCVSPRHTYPVFGHSSQFHPPPSACAFSMHVVYLLCLIDKLIATSKLVMKHMFFIRYKCSNDPRNPCCRLNILQNTSKKVTVIETQNEGIPSCLH